MHNLYRNSVINGDSLSFSNNDYHENCYSSFNGGCPSSSYRCCCCSCNCCSSVPINTVNSSRLVPVDPSPLYGFRQSALIQWPSSRRRMILATGDPINDLGRTQNTYGRISCIMDVGVDMIRDQGMKSKGKRIEFWGYNRMSVLEERYIFHKVGAACDDAEAIISLLSEEVGEERRKKVISSKKGKVRENAVDERSKVYDKQLEGHSWSELENLKARRRKEGYRMKHEGKEFLKGKDPRLRKGRITGSSSYSGLDLGDSEVTVANNEECTVIGNEKESRKRVRLGSVTVNELAKEELEARRIRRTQYLESGQRDHKETGSSKAHVSLEKQYNKRVGESISKLNSSELLGSRHHRKDNRASETSDSSNRYENVTESSVFLDEQTANYSSKVSGSDEHLVSTSEFCKTCGQVTSGSQAGTINEQQSELYQIQGNNTGFISNVETKVAFRQDKISSLIENSANEVHHQHKQEHVVSSNQINSRKLENYTEKVDVADIHEENTNTSILRAELSDIQNKDTRLTSNVKQQSETRINRQEDASTSIQTYLKDKNEKIHQEHLVATGQTELTRKSEKRIKIVAIGSSNVQDTSIAQHKQEARVKGSEESATSVSSQLANGGRYQTDMQVRSEKESTKASKVLSGSSQVHFNETTTINSSSASEERLNYQQSYLTEKVKETHEHVEERVKQTESYLTERVKETRGHVMEKVKQTELRYDVQTPLREPIFVKERSRRPYVTKTSQVRIEEIGQDEDETNLPSGPLPSLAPPPLPIELHPVYVESACRFPSQGSHKNPGESSIDIDPQATDVSPFVDLLGSAERMDNSSHQIIGEFVEKIRNDEATPSIEIENKLPERPLLSEGAEYAHEESVQSDSENGKLKKECSRHLSGSLTGKELTYETFTVNQPYEREASEDTENPQDIIVRRSGRSLWHVVANIVRLQWGMLAKNRKSSVEICGHSSLSDSVGSEKLLSGHDLDDAEGDSKGSGTIKMPLESSMTHQPLLVRTPTQNPREEPRVLNMGDSAGMATDNAPSFSRGGVSVQTDVELNVDETSSLETTSINPLQSAGRQDWRSRRRSDSINELQEGGKGENGGGTVEPIKGDCDPSLTVDSSSEENVAELKQRQLLRTNQFLKESFDEWEDAYRLESEKRKIDQTFMREALEEAKKAADLWEFPVGAVLVQNGEIIARGHNLVEDLRDSTAHAEIICIREASSILRTWRLSETTLYVTLEPCAMCAGAILQARIGTLVYGAPNKLLGADGSWVRLFPDSVNGEGGSESTAKQEGPVHPFHPKMTIRRGVLEEECGQVMQQSFKLRRKKGPKSEQPDKQRSDSKLHRPSKLLHKMHHMFHILFTL